jgi:class 3 adenylate cyclase
LQRPATRYLSVGGERLAYQVFGNGPVPTMHLSSWGRSVDAVWEHPGHLRIWRAGTTQEGRTIMFDHRGGGMSDAVPEARLGDLDERVEDALAVLDETGCERAHIAAEYDGVFTAVKLAVEHPERVDKLVLLNGTQAEILADPDEGRAARVNETAEWIRLNWGTGAVLRLASPWLAEDLDFAARFERIGMRPSAAAAMYRKVATMDVRDLVPRITAPTLVAYTGDIQTASLRRARELAAAIPDARMFEAFDSQFYWGDGFATAYNEFISGDVSPAADRQLLTLVFTDVVESTPAIVEMGDDAWRQTLDFLEDATTNRVVGAGGRVVKQTGDGHLLAFTRPSDALEVTVALLRDARTLGVPLRVGVHIGEVEQLESGDLRGLTVHIAARIASQAGAGEVVVSRTVAELLGASAYRFADRGEFELKGVPGRWTLLTLAP